MGLDMYLYAKKNIWNDDEKISEYLEAFIPELKGYPVRQITIEAMYWRKANAIHSWFVENVQEGKDDCGTYFVSHDKLNELKNLIFDVLETKDTDKLLPKAGFFFGSLDVDDWYWSNLERTLVELNNILSLPLDWYFEYRSSW